MELRDRAVGRRSLRRAAAVPLSFVSFVALVAWGCGAVGSVPQLPVGPGLTCDRLARDICERTAATLGFGVNPDVVGAHLRCTRASCTAAAGDVAAALLFRDGRVEQSGFGWTGAEPGQEALPEPPGRVAPGVRPVCVGLAEAQCHEQFDEIVASGVPSGRVALRVVIRCATTCDERSGEGETLLELDDGSSVTGSWTYTNG